MHRWVRYQAPVMVCVVTGDDGERVTGVVIGEDPRDIRLARGHDGHPLVYDEHMELLDPGDVTAQAAIHEAEDRDWPDPGQWEGGPDALHHPGLYDPDKEDDSGDLDPSGLDDASHAQAG